MWDTIQFILALLVMFGIPSILAYFCLFKAQHSNYPLALRGIGIALVAGILKLAAIVLSEHGLSLNNEPAVNYGLGIVLVIGLFMMMAGFGAGPTSPTRPVGRTSRPYRSRRR